MTSYRVNKHHEKMGHRRCLETDWYVSSWTPPYTLHMLAHVFKTSSMCSPADTEICTWHPTTSKMFYFTFFKCSLFWILCLSPKYRYIQLRVNKLDVVDILVTMLLQYCSRIRLHLSMISGRIPDIAARCQVIKKAGYPAIQMQGAKT